MRVVIKPHTRRGLYVVEEYDVDNDMLWEVYERLKLHEAPWIKEVYAAARDGRTWFIVIWPQIN